MEAQCIFQLIAKEVAIKKERKKQEKSKHFQNWNEIKSSVPLQIFSFIRLIPSSLFKTQQKRIKHVPRTGSNGTPTYPSWLLSQLGSKQSSNTTPTGIFL